MEDKKKDITQVGLKQPLQYKLNLSVLEGSDSEPKLMKGQDQWYFIELFECDSA